ncbi:MAG: uroporphyrinogen-III synthase [Acidimicrobiales bacterium]
MPVHVQLAPLQGYTIGLTADRRREEQAGLLRRRGAKILQGPTISTAVLVDDKGLRDATDAVIERPPEWLLATTGIGMRSWFETARAWGCDDALRKALAGARVLARGPKSAGAVEALGLVVWQRAASDRLSELVDMLSGAGVRGDTVVMQLYGEPSSEVTAAIAAMGAEVVEVATYEWRDPVEEGPALRLAGAVSACRVDAVTFTSAPAVRNLIAIAARHGLAERVLGAFNRRVVAACVGPACAEAARSVGIEAPVAPGVGRLGLLIRELTDEFARRRPVLVLAGHEVVLQGRLAVVEGDVIALGGRERDVLSVLAQLRGEVVPRAELLRAVWGEDAHDSHVMEVTISRLRSKLGAAGPALEAVSGQGYRLDAAS